jgi:GNAT superfamily N-acetyltransferase
MFLIRPATIDDVPLLRCMIRELAEFEGELESCVIEEADLRRDGFGENLQFRALVAECDQQPAGYALYFDCYSTWVGAEIFLEDLYVRPQFRSRGIGMGLLAEVARIALRENRRALRWEVLDWNKNAIELYEALGAVFCDQWRPVLLYGEPLRQLAQKTL